MHRAIPLRLTQFTSVRRIHTVGQLPCRRRQVSLLQLRTVASVVLLVFAVACPASAQGVLPDGLLKKIKKATVHLKVKLASGTDVEGTGWFVEPGLIATNAHVVGLQGQEAKLPTKIEAVIESGEPGSRTLIARFTGGDIDADLAVLRVIGENLPEPLTIGSTTDLVETQEVLIFGFPFGKQLGKAITVGKSSVTSLRKAGGELNEIQVNGGINPGNSGGPVVNLKGDVIGIAVSGILGSTVNMAVPVDKLSRLLNGKVVGFVSQPAVIEKDQIRIPIRITIRDPLKRVTNLKVEHWTGPISKAPTRPASETKPEPVAGDGPVGTVDFSFDGKTAYAYCDVPVPALTDSMSGHWLRVTYLDGLQKQHWTSASGNIRPVPTERREITLKFQPPTGPATPMQITNDSTFKVQVGKKSDTNSMHVRVITKPTYAAPSGPDGDIPLKWKFSSVTLGMKVNGESVNVKERWSPLGKNFLKTTATLEFADNGSVVNSRAELGKSDPELKSIMTAISDHLLQSVEVLSVPLPDAALRPMDRLRAQRTLLIGLPGIFVPAQADIRYQYLGVRTVAGNPTAAFEISGQLRPRRGDESKIGGRITGGVDLLLSTGEVYAGITSVLVDMELVEAGGIRLQGTLLIDYRRPPDGDAKPTASDDKKPEGTPATDEKSDADAAKPAEKTKS